MAAMSASMRQTQDRISGCATTLPDLRERWLGFIHRHLMTYRLGLGTATHRDFAMEAEGRSVADWSIIRITTTAGKGQLMRDCTNIASDFRERYIMYLSLRDTIEFEQFGRTGRCQAGTFTLLSSADPLVHSKFGDNDTIGFGMPREFVDQRLMGVERRCLTPIGVGEGLGRLVRESLLSLQQNAAKMTDEEFVMAAHPLADLVLLAFGGQADVTASTSCVRTSNLARAKRLIREQLSDPDLRLEDIARACGFSLSYLHKLFRDDGRSVREYVNEERLQKAHLLLKSGRAASVTSVALECGFSNMSHFSTAFRSAFGLSPRDVLSNRL
jgi:AraC-like DNA-binding protein